MKRRDFLRRAGIASAAAAIPCYPAARLFAAHDGYTGPLYLMIDAIGAWDPTSFCDPKGYATGQSSGRINNYPRSKIGKVGNIRYAPPPDEFLKVRPGTSTPGPFFDPALYSNKQFFEKYYQDLLIVNGIDVGTIAHSDGARTTWGGELGRSGYPTFAALVAGVLTPSWDIPFIANGGYTEAAGLVVPVRLNSKNSSALFEIAYPNRAAASSSTSQQYLTDPMASLVRAAGASRHQALLGVQRLPRLRTAINRLIETRAGDGHLKALANNLATVRERPASFFNGRSQARDLYRQGRIALAAYETGVSATAHLSMRGFDTHVDHDERHYPRLMDLLQGIDAILQEAEDRGLREQIVLVVGSDFGRTNAYNDEGGKDHWPITSMMFMGNSENAIRGNRVIGQTTNRHRAIKVDRNTLVADPSDSNANATRLKPAHIHHSLRALAGVDRSTAADLYGLGAEELQLF